MLGGQAPNWFGIIHFREKNAIFREKVAAIFRKRFRSLETLAVVLIPSSRHIIEVACHH